MVHSSYISHLDRLAISTSAVCIAHCLFLPLALTVFPAMGVSILAEQTFHALILWFVIPVSVIAVALGCWRHKDMLVFLAGFTGLAVLVLTAIYGHSHLGESGERAATVVASLILAVGHFRNFRLCRSDRCCH